MEGHGGCDKIARTEWERVCHKVGAEDIHVGDAIEADFPGKNIEHACGGIDREDMADAKSKRKGYKTGAGAVVQSGPVWTEGHVAVQGCENIGGEPAALGVCIPGLGAFIKGIVHGDFRA